MESGEAVGVYDTPTRTAHGAAAAMSHLSLTSHTRFSALSASAFLSSYPSTVQYPALQCLALHSIA